MTVDGFEEKSKEEQKQMKKEVKKDIEEVLDQHMIKNFPPSDERIPDGHDYITDKQWEAFVPKYRVMTGM